MKLQSDVCIVGAGPGGALLGYLLAKHNISTILLERHGGIDKEFRGEHLNAEGEHILKKHNLFEKIEAYGLLAMKRVEYWEHGKVIKTITPDPEIGHVGIHVPQNHLLKVLIKEAQQYEDYRLLMNAKVTNLLEDENGNYVGVKVKTNERDIAIHSSIIVGADGRYSTVRRLAHISVTIIKHGYDLLWAKIPAPSGWEPTIRMTMVNGTQLALFTQVGGFIQIGWNIEEGLYPFLRNQSVEPFINCLLDAFPELTDIVRQHIQSWKDFVLLQVHSSRCETWAKNGLVIMGDAAHTMTPTGALGINCAMKDADALADIIRAALIERDISAERLQDFEYVRRVEIEQQQEQQIQQEAAFKQNYVVSQL